jgi:hypothetical protein
MNTLGSTMTPKRCIRCHDPYDLESNCTCLECKLCHECHMDFCYTQYYDIYEIYDNENNVEMMEKTFKIWLVENT